MMPFISVRIPKKLQAQLRDISQKEKIPVSDLVRESPSRYIAVYHFRKLQAKALPYAHAKKFLTEEDIFRAIS